VLERIGPAALPAVIELVEDGEGWGVLAAELLAKWSADSDRALDALLRFWKANPKLAGIGAHHLGRLGPAAARKATPALKKLLASPEKKGLGEMAGLEAAWALRRIEADAEERRR
jgi:hypothetical protein